MDMDGPRTVKVWFVKREEERERGVRREVCDGLVRLALYFRVLAELSFPKLVFGCDHVRQTPFSHPLPRMTHTHVSLSLHP